MAYRFNGVECDTLEELRALQSDKRNSIVSAQVREEH